MANYNRRDFAKLVILGGIGYTIFSCVDDPKKDKTAKEVEETAPKMPELLPENIKIFQKADEEYQDLTIRFNKRIQQAPTFIAQCFNTKGVVDAILFAKFKDLKVVVKSGGHSFEGFSNTNDGLVIDVSAMKKMQWNDDHSVTVETGCILKELYDEMLPKQRILPSGSCATVGIAGLTLGGGYGFFSRKYGLTCDSLQEITMVDGNGNIHHESGNSAILKACKGGGNGNFGIVTKMKFRTYQAPKFFQTYRCKAYKLTTERAKSLLKMWFQYTKKLPNTAFSAFVLNGKTLTILITNYATDNKGVMKMYNALKAVSDKATIGSKRPLQKALKTFYGVQHPIYFKNACAGLYKDYTEIEGCMDDVISKVISSRGLIYQVNTLGGNINSSSAEKRSVFPHRSYPYLSELQSYWDKPSQEASRLKAFQEVQDRFYKHGIRAHYRNYPDINFKDFETSYYGKYLPELKAIKQQLDPENRIQHPQSISV
ncbi:FAD-binding oxidoreductase [Kordia algicida OT-1]|uniref:FAD-dependent oxidase n=1 Tax=Kordia algicida OT-1 TaxID=391587 RepID=A9DZL8_9FLAO|nr:FAD-binding oxidoreductase [Kordia algicida]EDP95740.1 FAD-dependent oxidase [Kordia algicida OT-1]